MILNDTIAAISSAAGAAARMIVRASGRDAHHLARDLCADWPAAGAAPARLSFNDLSVPCWLYVFHAPRSYTGEDLVELHIPGNPLLARMLLDELIYRGARLAEPGEFTARAYFNGRIDLTEAEGVAATIAAGSRRELLAARQLLSGELSRRLRGPMDLLAESLALVEVGIDFVEEDVTFIAQDELLRRIAPVDDALRRIISESARFERLAHEPQIVLVGRPNAGKSTLLNALAGRARAVVSDVAGTTRDVIWSEVPLPSGMIRLIDAAGLEQEQNPGDDVHADVARQMRQRALQAVESADVIVLVRDGTDDRPPLELPRRPDFIVSTKLDLVGRGRRFGEALAVSAATGENLDTLRRRLDELAFGGGGEASLALNSRHLRLIEEARQALARASEGVQRELGSEVVAMELREVLDALGGVLGSVTPDDLLGRIFATFCIGK